LILFYYVIKMNNKTGRYLKKVPPDKIKELDKTFLVALSIGILGLMLNGITINIFDSSKVAMCLWASIGVAAKVNSIYRREFMHAVTDSSEVIHHTSRNF